jgi:cell division protein FtsB
MIKNRESAARSRLKRQQHTTQLEQENAQLRSQVAALTAQVITLKYKGGWMGGCVTVCR